MTCSPLVLIVWSVEVYSFLLLLVNFLLQLLLLLLLRRNETKKILKRYTQTIFPTADISRVSTHITASTHNLSFALFPTLSPSLKSRFPFISMSLSLSLSFPHTISRRDRWLRAGLRRGRWRNRWRLLCAGNTHTNADLRKTLGYSSAHWLSTKTMTMAMETAAGPSFINE